MSEAAGPLLCGPDEKNELEARNGARQLEYIDHLVSTYGATKLRESHVLALQSLAVEDIYPCGGRYRDARMRVEIQNSPHTLPEPSIVPFLVREAVDWINGSAPKRSAMERAAYALWRFNWIHPFAGGNGRTSRALAYLVLCMDAGAVLPGTPMMPTIIYEHRHAYIDALRDVDSSVTADAFDLSTMTEFLRRMLMKQLAHVIDSLSRPGR